MLTCSAALPVLELFIIYRLRLATYIMHPVSIHHFIVDSSKPPRWRDSSIQSPSSSPLSAFIHLPLLTMATAAPQGPPGHAHPHPHPPQPGQPGVRPPPGMMMGPSPPPNPALQAILDAIPHVNVPFSIQEGTIPNTNPPQTTTMVTCDAHKQVICKICDVHFGPINYMFNFLKGAPAEAIPPPPNAPTQPQRAEAIKQAKEAGNVCTPTLQMQQETDEKNAFKSQNYQQAAALYSRSADMALSRPPWEPSGISREETVVALCNRSAAFAYMGNFGGALADAEAVVQLKRPWTKGHFRYVFS